jgi:hypothetical protein
MKNYFAPAHDPGAAALYRKPPRSFETRLTIVLPITQPSRVRHGV